MKITRVGSVLLQPMPWVLVKIETDEGITGIGEAYHGPGVHQIVVDERLTRLLIGQDPRNVDKLFHDMMDGMSASGYYQGAVMSAISGIEGALWDITGQATGLPIWQLLGGKFRDKIRMYASLFNPVHTPEAYVETAQEAEAMGFTQVKFGIEYLHGMRRDFYNRSLSNDEIAHNVKVCAALRKNLKSNTDIAMDCHWAYAPVDMVKLARAVEDLNLAWLEDPIPPENVAAMAQLKSQVRTPIATGENFYTRFGFRDLIQSQAADIITPDLAKAGGLLEGRRIADMADMYYINVAPHHVCGPIETVAVCHLCAAIPNFQAFEFHYPPHPLWHAMIEESPLIQDGFITVPNRPGLGMTLNEDALRSYVKQDFGFLG
ncbi:MAG: mandelate racemase/muconate lactonizing enzyme family protein [Chloroflexi bacterium]|nr:mandelate racemase/muconate lactonizing enzyme family protein [Chloroflexota bacterium]